jgi:hypothetical protein
MLVVEIALIVCKKILCKDLSKDQMKNIISGNATEAAPAEDTAPVEEAAPAEEAEVK